MSYGQRTYGEVARHGIASDTNVEAFSRTGRQTYIVELVRKWIKGPFRIGCTMEYNRNQRDYPKL